jgi:hypothetical protein
MSPSTPRAGRDPSPPAEAAPRPPSSSRLWQVDALRGLMLVLMTLTHVPSKFSSPSGQPFGYVSAAEGFVLLSAFMAGLVYSKKLDQAGESRMRFAFAMRVLKIYLAQAALLLFLFSAVAAIGVATGQPAITNLVGFYLENPLVGLVAALFLVYNPPLLDILPMYIVFMLASPVLLLVGRRRHGWTLLLAGSTLLWFAAQWDLRGLLHLAFVHATKFPVPNAAIGAFDILAWQLLWVLGLWIGATYAKTRRAPVFPAWAVAVAAVWALVCFVWRHAVGQVPFGDDWVLNAIFDKWLLGPLRLLDLFALLILAVHFRDAFARLPRIRVLETLGTASLPVFCAHLVVALLALALFGEPTPERSWWFDTGLMAAAFAILYAVALVSAGMDRYAATVRARFEKRRQARAKSARRAGSAVGAVSSRWPAAGGRAPER